ncbi:nodulin homeobox-like isoform X1 [Camellia sinensis]|uniref:nodulin homeobox-like isoform X1 n=5 Tax=Camellia sinensis TaxID=4442 RepID=UPI001035ADAA|nr:nodulin homeobox-like isoform X1 [Camellia sinensis]
MSDAMAGPSSRPQRQAIDLISAVKELHRLSSLELNKLIRESRNNILHIVTETGSSIQIDVENLARYLPMHLMARMMMLAERDEALFQYLLCGVRLLHSLCDLAPRHSILEQILLDDVKVSVQLLDLIIFLLIFLSNYRQEHHTSSPMPLLHSALVACSLYLLTGCISSQWQELALVLVSHSQVDVFMDTAFAALRLDIKFLHIKLSGQCTEGTLNYLSQQCEASLQFLQSLCQQKLFRERLVKNKELCGKGGVLLLARAILNLEVTPLFKESFSVVAAISRLKSKILSILLHLCEAESISFLDEVARTPQSMDLAKSVALEVLELLKTMIVRDPKQLACSDKNYPTGLLQLNAMRLADIFSDDSNFRSYIMIYYTEVLTAIFALPHQEFLSNWCSSDLPTREEDATLEYDLFAAAGCVLDSSSSSDLPNVMNSGPNFIPINIPWASYAHQRSSLLVKIIANLHCFVPEICKEEKDVFLDKFLECLQREQPISPASDAEKAVTVSSNLCSLLSHAESLTPSFLNKEDVHLLRVFFMQLESLITSAEFENRVQENKFEGSECGDKLSKLNISEHFQENQKSAGGCSSPLLDNIGPDHTNRIGNLKEGMSEKFDFQEEDQLYVRSSCIDQTGDMMLQDKEEDKSKYGTEAGGFREIQNVETSGSDSSSTREKNSKESGIGGVLEDEKVEDVQCEEKQQRKRKRTIMNDEQIAVIERALLDEPDMQRNFTSVQSWADKLSLHGSEVTTSQLKNWLNNRKARLTRAAKDGRAPSVGDNVFPDKQGVSGIVSL